MPLNPGGEIELCEECGSPLEDGLCPNCGGGFREGASPVGAAPLGRDELSKVLRKPVGTRMHGSYVLSMQQEKGLAPLRKQIDSLVEQFSASPELRAMVKQNAERLAVKIVEEVGPTKAAIASVAEEFLRLGRNLSEISLSISKVHPSIGQSRDIVIEVYATSDDAGILVNSRMRRVKSQTVGLYKKLRIPLFVSDGSALVQLRNASLTRNGYDAKRAKPLGPSEFVVKVDDRNFELFKVLEKARFCGAPNGMADQAGVSRRYSISKLPLTERLLRESGHLQKVNALYVKLYSQKIANGRGRSPQKLAEDALGEACERVVPEALSDVMVRKYHLRPSAMRSLIVKSELDNWRGRS